MRPSYLNFEGGEKCYSCRKPLVTIVRLSDKKMETQNTATICANKNCSMGVDLKKVKNWRIKSED